MDCCNPGSGGGGPAEQRAGPLPVAELKLRVYRRIAARSTCRYRQLRRWTLLLLLAALAGWGAWAQRFSRSRTVRERERQTGGWLFLAAAEYGGSGGPETIPEKVRQEVFFPDRSRLLVLLGGFQEEQHLNGTLALAGGPDREVCFAAVMRQEQLLLLLKELQHAGGRRTGGSGPAWTQKIFLGAPETPVAVELHFRGAAETGMREKNRRFPDHGLIFGKIRLTL